MNLSWHQQQALERAHKTRNLPAHIYGDGLKALCGVYRPKVWIYPDERGNPANRCCKKCAAITDKKESPNF